MMTSSFDLKKYLFGFFFIFLIWGTDSLHAQHNIQTESQLAFQYYRDKEFKPASVLFHNLFTLTRSKTYFTYYVQSLVQLEEFQEVTKYIKKQIRKNPDDKSFRIALGHVYKQWGKEAEAVEIYNKILDELIPVKTEIKSIANEFVAKQEYEYAIKSYEKGRQLLRQKNSFHLEMANVFLYQRDFEKMVKEYLMAVAIDPSNVNMVQNRLQSALVQDINSSLDPILRNQLLQRIQSEQNNVAFKELLLWYFMQKKQFKPAFTQAKSIDLIQNEDGFRLLSLAQAARNNKDYETAIKCYEFVLEKGSKSPNYLRAKIGMLDTKYIRLQEEKENAKEAWLNLAKEYEQFFSEYNKSILISQPLTQFAHIKAFYLYQEEKAIKLLEDALKTKGGNLQNQSEIKMELADILLFFDKKWDAVLLYAQVEKSNPNNPIGFEAKFKKAKVSYYMGELKWAKAQLDALKGSTSKLIANDAIFLSQLISDNTSLDTSYTAMKMYANAEFLLYRKKNSLALQELDLLLKNYPGHSLSDEVLFKKFEIYLDLKQEEKALEMLSAIRSEYPYDLLADKALFKQAELFEKRNEEAKATENYKLLLTEYPESIYTVEARQRLNKLRSKK